MIVSKSQFAEITGASARTVGRWITEGLPAERRGQKGAQLQIDTARAIAWLIANGGRPDTQQSPTAAYRDRLVAAQAEQAELALAERRRELLESEQVAIAMHKGIGQIRAELLQLPGRLAFHLAEETEPAKVKNRLRREIHQALAAGADALRLISIEITPREDGAK